MKKVTIIAEAGVNHNGDIEKAKQLIDAAAEASADYVKFQSFKAKKLVSKDAKKAAYQSKNLNDGDAKQYQMLKRLELSKEDHHRLIAYCNKKDIKFLSTAFDREGLTFLDHLNLDVFKVPSGEITNYPYLKRLASIKKPVIMSTGMANLGEIEAALQVLNSEGLDRKHITVLHCNTEYPTPMHDVNLKAMLTIQQAFGVAVGYSDHTRGIEVPIAAVAMGASVIEKHFTLDRNLPGPDHRASLEPQELIDMVSAVRNIEQAIAGNGNKEASDSERKNISVARKSIHFSSALKAGETIEEKHLIPLRPGDGISPMEWDKIIGKKTVKDVQAFEMLTPGKLS